MRSVGRRPHSWNVEFGRKRSSDGFYLEGQRLVNYGLISINCSPPWGIVVYCFGLVGFPRRVYGFYWIEKGLVTASGGYGLERPHKQEDLYSIVWYIC